MHLGLSDLEKQIESHTTRKTITAGNSVRFEYRMDTDNLYTPSFYG